MLRSYLKIILATLLWGTIVLFHSGLAVSGISSVQIVQCRVAVTAVVLGIYILITDRKQFKIYLADAWVFVGSGCLSFVLLNLCYFKAIEMISASVAVVLMNTAPIFIMLFSIFLFRERMNKYKVFALFVTMLGCAFAADMFSPGIKVSTIGLLFGLGSGVTYGLYSIFCSLGVRRGYSNLTITFYTFLSATIGCAFFSKPLEIAVNMNLKTALLAVGMGIFSTMLPYTLYSSGLQKIKPSTASIVATLELVFTSIISFIFLGDSLTVGKILGDMMIIAAVVLLNLKADKTTA